MEDPPQGHRRFTGLLLSRTAAGRIPRWLLLARLPSLRPRPEHQSAILVGEAPAEPRAGPREGATARSRGYPRHPLLGTRTERFRQRLPSAVGGRITWARTAE